MKKEFIIFVVILIIVLITIFVLFKCEKIDSSYDFKIHFFKAGKADAILISKNDKHMMIDTGEETLSGEILAYLKKNNINILDYLIITHFDKDHVGSASKIIDNVKISEILESNYPKNSIYYNNYLKSINEKKILKTTINGDKKIEFADLDVIVNGPDKIYDSNESNNSSLIVSIKYKDKSFLFMGDAENARIKDFLNANEETYDFLKMPYHGRYLKRLDELFELKKIKYAVITNNELDEKVQFLLNKYNIKYYLTNKSIDIYSNGFNIIK